MLPLEGFTHSPGAPSPLFSDTEVEGSGERML